MELRFGFVIEAPEPVPPVFTVCREWVGPDGARLRLESTFVKPGKASPFLRCILNLSIETKVRHAAVAKWMLEFVPRSVRRLYFEEDDLPLDRVAGAIGLRARDLPHGPRTDPPEDPGDGLGAGIPKLPRLPGLPGLGTPDADSSGTGGNGGCDAPTLRS